MRPIRPVRLLTGSLLVEAAPLAEGFSKVYRGVEVALALGRHDHRRPPDATPYRVAPTLVPSSVLRRVIVREWDPTTEDEPWAQALFEKATLTRRRMSKTPAPELLHTLGLGDKLLASVEEYLCGATLDVVLRRLRAHGLQMPIPIALAIGHGLLPLWTAATSAPTQIRFLLDPSQVILEATGAIRALPDYAEERARQFVGAAVAVLRAPVSYSPPELILGEQPGLRGGMFTLGLLLYEMIAGAHPVASADTTMFQILSRMAREDVPPLSERRRAVHASVAEVVHRCLARDPVHRFASWRELHEVLAGVRALFPVTGDIEIAEYLRSLLPVPITGEIEIDLEHDAWTTMISSGYHPVSLPEALADEVVTRAPRRAPEIHPDAVYVGVDTRPMFVVSEGLLVDARPVTSAELERFRIVTGMPKQTGPTAVTTAFEDEPCTFVSVELAEAYARWAGKRLPTDAEWDASLEALGAARLGIGEVWEWTSTSHPKGGRVVRGGRWRDQATVPARPENRSFETSSAADVGFRCVVSTRPT